MLDRKFLLRTLLIDRDWRHMLLQAKNERFVWIDQRLIYLM